MTLRRFKKLGKEIRNWFHWL